MAKNWRVKVLVPYVPARLNEFFVRLFNSWTKILVLTNQKRKETAVKGRGEPPFEDLSPKGWSILCTWLEIQGKNVDARTHGSKVYPTFPLMGWSHHSTSVDNCLSYGAVPAIPAGSPVQLVFGSNAVILGWLEASVSSPRLPTRLH